MEPAVNPSPDDLLSAAALAESIASEMTKAADTLAKQGKAAAVRALLAEARHHTVEAIRLRAQAAALRKASEAKPRARGQPD